MLKNSHFYPFKNKMPQNFLIENYNTLNGNMNPDFINEN